MANYRRMARRAARRRGIDERLFVRQIGQESGWNPDVISGRRRSSAGALGIAQFMPETARGLGVDPLNPRQALDAAARLMADYIRQYGGWENALRAYNAGPGNIERSKGFSETNEYVRRILSGEVPQGGRNVRGGGGGGGGPVTVTGRGSATVASRVPIDVSSSGSALTVLADALEQRREQPQMFGHLPMSDLAARAPLPEAFTPVQPGRAPGPEATDFGRLLRVLSAQTAQQGQMMATVTGRGRASRQVTVDGGEMPGGGGGRGGGRVRAGGGWGGTEGIIQSIDRIAGQVGAGVGSGKRSHVPPGGSTTSDHLTTSKNAFARDYTGSEQARRALAKRIADSLGVKHTFGGADTNVVKEINGRKYRFQLITRPHGTGPHVHLGVRLVG